MNSIELTNVIARLHVAMEIGDENGVINSLESLRLLKNHKKIGQIIDLLDSNNIENAKQRLSELFSILIRGNHWIFTDLLDLKSIMEDSMKLAHELLRYVAELRYYKSTDELIKKYEEVLIEEYAHMDIMSAINARSMIRSAGASLIEAITTLNHLNESLEHECEPEEDSTFPCEPESILVFNSVVESICACMGVVLECMGNARGANIGAHSKVGKLVSSDGATAVLHLGSGESLSFVWCPEQSFKMGSYDCPPTMGVAAKNEQILTKCDGFWITATPITQSFWQAVMAQNPSHHKGRDKPVEGITWFDAMLFTQILNLRTERPPNLRFALPTDMQWECACRHGSEANLTSNRNSECGIYTAYTARASDTNYAYLYSDASDALDEVAWYYHNSNTTTHEVGGKAPSPLGLYDMHGNVSEWCLDWEEGEEADEKYAKSLRGGSYMDYPSSCLAGSKGSCPPIESCRSVGMRLIINHTRSGQ